MKQQKKVHKHEWGTCDREHTIGVKVVDPFKEESWGIVAYLTIDGLGNYPTTFCNIWELFAKGAGNVLGPTQETIHLSLAQCHKN